MASSRLTSRLRTDAGFTLVELLAAMAISTIVLLATLTTLDTFSRNAAQQTRVTDANDQVRAVMDRVVADLRQAATVEVARSTDLVYTVIESATATRRERVCLDSSNYVWRSSVRTASPPTTPIAAGTPCPTAGSGAFKVTTLKSANSTSNPMFRYDSATAASVRSVGITIALDAGNGGRTDTSTLRASTFVRSKTETAAPIDNDDLTTTCNDTGQPTLTLSSGVGPLSVSYTDLDGTALGNAQAGSSLTLTGAHSTVIANITSTGAGLVSQLVREISC
jgi:prepilin-type N-terminal cleavage/methylation domain-containing protein